jgi:hypothetical protein
MEVRMNRPAAVLAGVLVLGATTVPASATLSGAVSGLCPVTPVEVATTMANTNSPTDPLPGSANCPALCSKWASACKGAVAVAKSCRNGVLAKLVSLRNASCSVHTDAALKDSCKNGVNVEKNIVKAQTDSSVATAKDYCEGGGITVCLSKCSI